MEEQAGLHARQRIEILQQRAVGVCKLRGTVGYLSQQTIQAFLRELQQGEILGNIGEEIILCTHSQPTFIEKRCVSEVIVSKSSYCIPYHLFRNTAACVNEMTCCRRVS